jgi:putative ABC transport system ATP-binding protein
VLEETAEDPARNAATDLAKKRTANRPSDIPTDTADKILSLADVRLTLAGNAGPVEVLRGIDLKVARGESLGLVGPSGSGKSSLLMLMGGLERATAGRVTALGQDLGAMSEDALARFRRRNMGIVFQSFHLIPTLTAQENVALPLELAGTPDAMARAGQELAAMGLAARTGHYPAQLSGGEQQRVALARAFIARPAILLADEPTGNLDAATGTAIMDQLFALRDRHGATLVLVTHAPELAARCDRIVHLSDGMIAP